MKIKTPTYVTHMYPKNPKALMNTFLICVMAGLLVYIVYRTYFVKREGVVNQINAAIRDIKNVGNQVKKIPNDISNVGRQVGRIPGDIKREVGSVSKQAGNEMKKITGAVDKGVKQVRDEGNKITNAIDTKLKNFVKMIKDIVDNKLKSFFTKLGKELKRAFVEPTGILFAAIGSVFKLLGEILQMIIDKIVSLPDCVPYYSMSAGKGMTKQFLPDWLYNTIMFFHKLWMGVLNLLKPVLKLIGIDVDAWQREVDRKCYKFNVKGKTKQMETKMKNAGKNFTKEFGRIDFKRLVK